MCKGSEHLQDTLLTKLLDSLLNFIRYCSFFSMHCLGKLMVNLTPDSTDTKRECELKKHTPPPGHPGLELFLIQIEKDILKTLLKILHL